MLIEAIAGIVAVLLIVTGAVLALHRTQRMVLLVVTHSTELARRFETRFTLTDGHLA